MDCGASAAHFVKLQCFWLRSMDFLLCRFAFARERIFKLFPTYGEINKILNRNKEINPGKRRLRRENRTSSFVWVRVL